MPSQATPPSPGTPATALARLARSRPTPRRLAVLLAALTLPAMAVIGTAIALQMPEPPERSYTPAPDPLQGTDLLDAALRRLESASSYRLRAIAHEGDGSGPYQDRPKDTRRALGVNFQWFTHTTDPVPAVLLERSGDGASPVHMWADGTPVVSRGAGPDQWFHDDPAYAMDEEDFRPVRTALEDIADHGNITQEDRATFTPDPDLTRGEETTGPQGRPAVRLRGHLETAEGATEFVLFTTAKGTPLALSTETVPADAAATWTVYREYEVLDLDAPVDLAVPEPDEIGPFQDADGY
ncbi:hypothetical protein ACFXKD_30145 [Nocardiopsis aegyptia]|uniref:hypothetical protein n=1 Tax=Nocardiopsis aegyptia TaxID=220378 RepID=UPI00366EEC71